MRLDRHYTDPELVALYDAENAGRSDIDFYLGLAVELGAALVTDLGCGTGVLACDLARDTAVPGRIVTGVDPSAEMLAIARSRPGGAAVRWLAGDSSALENGSADLVVMTGHVAQVFLTDSDWEQVVHDCARALRPGGHLAFETRNPQVSSWTRWTKAETTDSYVSAGGRPFTSWIEVTDVRGELVDFLGHNVFDDSGQDVLSRSTLAFRSLTAVERSLTAAGLQLVHSYGDWQRGSISSGSPELILVARSG